MSKFFGKYRGSVVNNMDPLQLGRIQVSVPAILGDGRMSWAMPCVPFAGSGVGLFAIPPAGANVWVEFEGGDTDYPIWSGCFWGTGEVPAPGAIPQIKMLKTDMVTLTLDDTLGAITIETSAGMKISVDATGIQIDNAQGGSVTLKGPTVSVNNGALEVV